MARDDDDTSATESMTSPSSESTSAPSSTSTTSSPTSTTSPTTSSTSTSSTTSAPSSTSATSSPDGSATTSSPTSTPASTTGPIPSVAFPDSFGEWTKSDSATDTLAIYRKGEDEALSVVAIPRDQVDGFYDRIWEDPSKHGDITCGKLSTSANHQCVGVVDGNGVLVSGSSETAAETAQILTDLLAAIAAA